MKIMLPLEITNPQSLSDTHAEAAEPCTFTNDISTSTEITNFISAATNTSNEVPSLEPSINIENCKNKPTDELETVNIKLTEREKNEQHKLSPPSLNYSNHSVYSIPEPEIKTIDVANPQNISVDFDVSTTSTRSAASTNDATVKVSSLKPGSKTSRLRKINPLEKKVTPQGKVNSLASRAIANPLEKKVTPQLISQQINSHTQH